MSGNKFDNLIPKMTQSQFNQKSLKYGIKHKNNHTYIMHQRDPRKCLGKNINILNTININKKKVLKINAKLHEKRKREKQFRDNKFKKRQNRKLNDSSSMQIGEGNDLEFAETDENNDELEKEMNEQFEKNQDTSGLDTDQGFENLLNLSHKQKNRSKRFQK